MTPVQLTVSLTHAGAPLGHPARLRLHLYLSGMLVGDKAEAGGTVAQTGAGIRTFAVSALQLAQLHGLAKQAGFPGRIPDVRPRNDTSDGWSQVLLYVALDGTSRTLELSLLSSGFEGPDAPALRRFFRDLLSLAGVQDEAILFSLTAD